MRKWGIRACATATGVRSMPDRRRLHLDLAATALLLAGLLVALSVFSHDPADPPSATVHPAHEVPTNLLGSPGAWLAHSLHETLGVAVYVFLASWFVLVVFMYLRRSLLTWSLRLAGWLILLPCAAVLADALGPSFAGNSLSGSGGSLGAWLAG